MSSPVSGSIRDSAVSRATSFALRAERVRTTAATTAIEAATSHHWSNVPPGACSTTMAWATATVATTATVWRVPKKLETHSTDHAYMTAPLPGGLVATAAAISTAPIGPSQNRRRGMHRPP